MDCNWSTSSRIFITVLKRLFIPGQQEISYNFVAKVNNKIYYDCPVPKILRGNNKWMEWFTDEFVNVNQNLKLIKLSGQANELFR